MHYKVRGSLVCAWEAATLWLEAEDIQVALSSPFTACADARGCTPTHLTAAVRTLPAGALPQAWFRRGAWRRLLHLNLGANSLQGPLPDCMEGCLAALDELGLHDNM
jgi:hypothetical protein